MMERVGLLCLLLCGCLHMISSETLRVSETEGKMAKLPCGGKTTGSVTWSRDTNGQREDILTTTNGKTTKLISDPDRRYDAQADLALTIRRVSQSDAGRYYCGGATVELTVTDKTLRVTEGTQAVLHCGTQTTGSVTWSRDTNGQREDILITNGEVMFSADSRYTTGRSLALIIYQVSQSDAGTYYCNGTTVELTVTPGTGLNSTTTATSTTSSRTATGAATATNSSRTATGAATATNSSRTATGAATTTNSSTTATTTPSSTTAKTKNSSTTATTTPSSTSATTTPSSTTATITPSSTTATTTPSSTTATSTPSSTTATAAATIKNTSPTAAEARTLTTRSTTQGSSKSTKDEHSEGQKKDSRFSVLFLISTAVSCLATLVLLLILWRRFYKNNAAYAVSRNQDHVYETIECTTPSTQPASNQNRMKDPIYHLATFPGVQTTDNAYETIYPLKKQPAPKEGDENVSVHTKPAK